MIACIAAVAVFIARAELAEKTLDRLNAGRSFDRVFCLALLSAKTALFDLERAVARVEESRRLAAKMNFAVPLRRHPSGPVPCEPA